MRYRSVLLSAAGAVPVAAVIWLAGADPQQPASPIDDFVEREIDRLSSPERTERIAAEQALLRGGPVLLERLPLPESVADPAARAAIVRIRKQLEEQNAQQETGATLVTLEGTETVAEMALRLNGWSGYQLGFTPEQNEQVVEMQARQEPFWPVLDELVAQVGLWPDRYDDFERVISFRERTAEDDASRIAYSGPFRLVAGPVSLRPVSGDAERRLARLPLELFSEPKLRPLFISYAARDFTLTTAGGKTLDAFTPRAKYELPFAEGGNEIEISLDFLAPAMGLGEPLSLDGRLTVTAAAGEEWFPYGFAGGSYREQSRGGVTIRFREATAKPDGTAEVELSVVYDEGGPAFESHRTWVFHNAAYVSCSRGEGNEAERVQLKPEPGFSTVAQADGGVVLRYRFSGIPADAKHVYFNYKAPTKIIDIPIEVEIDGLNVSR